MSKEVRFTNDGDPLPGSDREREKYGAIPTLASEMVGAVVKGERPHFPFKSWALSAQFRYPAEAEGILSRCDSAAEAFFVRAFVTRGGIRHVDGAAVYVDGTSLRVQVPRGKIRLDAVVERKGARIAVEVDGWTYHFRKDQMAADYIRERRVSALGFVVVRFTANEVFADADECWRQLDAILTAHTKAA